MFDVRVKKSISGWHYTELWTICNVYRNMTILLICPVAIWMSEWVAVYEGWMMEYTHSLLFIWYQTTYHCLLVLNSHLYIIVIWSSQQVIYLWYSKQWALWEQSNWKPSFQSLWFWSYKTHILFDVLASPSSQYHHTHLCFLGLGGLPTDPIDTSEPDDWLPCW